MYIPEHFRVRNQEDAIAFMHANPFAILISTTDEAPTPHICPLFVQAEGDRVTCAATSPRPTRTGVISNSAGVPHDLSRPAFLRLAKQLHCPESVPTWNYAAVHVYGKQDYFPPETTSRACSMSWWEPSSPPTATSGKT